MGVVLCSVHTNVYIVLPTSTCVCIQVDDKHSCTKHLACAHSIYFYMYIFANAFEFIYRYTCAMMCHVLANAKEYMNMEIYLSMYVNADMDPFLLAGYVHACENWSNFLFERSDTSVYIVYAAGGRKPIPPGKIKRKNSLWACAHWRIPNDWGHHIST